jgi:hypothetical protein
MLVGLLGSVLLHRAAHVCQEFGIHAIKPLPVVPPNHDSTYDQPENQSQCSSRDSSRQPCVGLGVEVEDPGPPLGSAQRLNLGQPPKDGG